MTDAYTGFQEAADSSSQYNALHFLVMSILAGVNTATIVQVKKVTNTGAAAVAGYVDVQPLVNQVDGAGRSQAHGVIHSCPYLRLQAGANAVIMDPEVGDIGLMVFADRDLSKVIGTQAAAAPGSARKFDMADGLYVGSLLGKTTPTRYLRFSADGLEVQDGNGNSISMASGGVNMTDTNGNSIVTGSTGMTFTDANGNTIVMGSAGIAINGIDFSTHVHSGVQTGGGTSGPPV